MIQELKIKNYLSFKDEVVFNFEASNDKFADECQVIKINDNTRLLRFAVIYGYNASGKTNLLKAFDFLRKFWFNYSDDMDEETNTIPFKLDNKRPSEPSRFELVFYVNEVKYSYILELDQKQVYFEKLSYYRSTQPVMLFERTFDNGQSIIDFNPNADKISNAAKEKITVECLRNVSFFAARQRANVNLPIIDAARDWMKNHFMPLIAPTTDLTMYAEKQNKENSELSKHIINFLKEADFNITNISTDIISRPLPEDTLNLLIDDEDIPDKEKERLKKEKTIKISRTVFEHTVENDNGKESYTLNRRYESMGTLRTFGIETALYNALKHSTFLPIDEFETSLHPKLLEKILFEYLKTPARTQVIVATHNDGLLDLINNLIRKDSVWFSEKGKDGATDIYKLTDFRGINRISSIREAYRSKRFGATMNSLWENEI